MLFINTICPQCLCHSLRQAAKQQGTQLGVRNAGATADKGPRGLQESGQGKTDAPTKYDHEEETGKTRLCINLWVPLME